MRPPTERASRALAPSALTLPAVVLVVVLASSVAGAQLGFIGPIAPIDEIPLTSQAFVGARALGMGGVAFAVADDGSAMRTNPAALARLRRSELSGGVSRRTDDLTGEAFGSPFETSLARTRLSSMRFAYAFPTFRGSLVLGMSTDLAYDFDDDFLAAYDDTFNFGGHSVGQIEGYLQEGAVYAWNFSGAFDASENVSLGATVSYYTGDYRQSYAWRVTDQDDLPPGYDLFTDYEFRTSSSVSGWRGTFGALFYATEKLALGFVMDTPLTLTFRGTRVDQLRYTNPPELAEESVSFTDKVTIPFGFGGGIAYFPTDLVVIGGDVYHVDWSQLRYSVPDDITDPTQRLPYEPTTDLRVGIEVTIPSWPLRLRGGYMTRPIAYQGLEISRDRSFFTVGAGLLIDTVFSLDAAFMWGGSERHAAYYDYEEKTEETVFIIEGAYRF
jgi:long-subunit fatty acid transport protein